MSRYNLPRTIEGMIKTKVQQVVKDMSSSYTNVDTKSTSTISTMSQANDTSSDNQKLVKTSQIHQNSNSTMSNQAQQPDLLKKEQLIKLSIKHTTVCDNYVNALVEISNIKVRIKKERKRHKKETGILRGKLRVLLREQQATKKSTDDDDNCNVPAVSKLSALDTSDDRISFNDRKKKSIQEPSHKVECDSIGRGTAEHSNNLITGSGDYSNSYRYENNSKLIAEIMEMKLQLAKARSEVDYNILQLNRVKIERDVLLNQQQAQFLDDKKI